MARVGAFGLDALARALTARGVPHAVAGVGVGVALGQLQEALVVVERGTFRVAIMRASNAGRQPCDVRAQLTDAGDVADIIAAWRVRAERGEIL